ncbi:MAG: arsenic efflux protein, partial [Clostridia bacterium]|nr:arsenic efflux protein [Clostridia bacterium]
QGLFKKTKGLGPLLGATLGTIPQCGFSVVAAALFAKRTISLGTLIAIFIATSDEAIPLMISHPDKIADLGLVIVAKFLVAVIFGFLIDLVWAEKSEPSGDHHHHFHGNCENCEGGVLKSALIHSVKIFVYIFIVNVIIGYAAEKLVPVMQLISENMFVQTVLAVLFGSIPNCAASVAIVELYLADKITVYSLLGGLCTGAGVGLLVLFKQNKSIKQNVSILITLYGIGLFVGITMQYLAKLI